MRKTKSLFSHWFFYCSSISYFHLTHLLKANNAKKLKIKIKLILHKNACFNGGFGRPSSNPRSAWMIGVIGWYSANSLIAVGIFSVGANPELK